MALGRPEGGLGPRVTTVLQLDDPDEIAAQYMGDVREPHDDRPWMSVGMVQSVDGGTAVEGRSSAIGGPPDLVAFRLMRTAADVVLVGAGTARAERYRAVHLPDRLVEWRRSTGRSDVPRLALVSRSLELDPNDDLAASRPIVLTVRSADPAKRRSVAEWAEVHDAGDDGVDATEAATVLRGLGAAVVHAEGGPRLNGTLLAGGVVDEIAVTVAPLVVGGRSSRIVVGPEATREATLDRVILSEGHLLLRYLL